MIQDINVNSVEIGWKGYGVSVRITCPPGEITIGVVGEDPPPPLKVVSRDEPLPFDAAAPPNREVDEATGRVVEPFNLYEDIRNRAKAFLTHLGVRYIWSGIKKPELWWFPDMDTIDPNVLDGLKGIYGPVEFQWRCGTSDDPLEGTSNAPEA